MLQNPNKYWIDDRDGKIRIMSAATVYEVEDKKRSDYYLDVLRTFSWCTDEVMAEIERHFNKRGDQYLSPERWLAVIFEEFGEAVTEINKKNWLDAHKELVETITCLIRLLNEVDAQWANYGPRPGVSYGAQD